MLISKIESHCMPCILWHHVVMKKVLLLLTLLSSLTGCATDSSAVSQYEKPLLWVKDADAELDAKAALKKGDFRLLAFSQRGTIIPGIDSSLNNEYELKCGIRMLEGMTDTVRGQEHLELMQQVHAYAKAYNELIKQSCKP